MKKVVFESVGNVLLFVLMGLAFMFPFSRYEGGATADGFSLSVHLSPLMAVFVVMTLINYHYLSGGPDKSANEFMDEVGRQQGRRPFMPFGRCVALCVPLALALAVNLLVQMGGA